MTRALRFPVSLFLLAALSCTSYRADMKTICEAEKLSMVDTTSRAEDPTMRFRYVADWIDRNISTEEARAVMVEVRPDIVLNRDKAKKIRAAATQVGLSECAFADSLGSR